MDPPLANVGFLQRWGFPSKQNPAHRNEALVARTRELWERNTTQKDMINILHAEGYTISERELMRLRSKHRLLLRGANAVKSASLTAATPDLNSVEQTALLVTQVQADGRFSADE